MYHPNHDKRGWAKPPQTPLQWHQKWTTERRMDVPGRRGVISLELSRVDVAPENGEGSPDLFITAEDGREFYLAFQRGTVYRAMDKPLLIYPLVAGAGQAIWVLPQR